MWITEGIQVTEAMATGESCKLKARTELGRVVLEPQLLRVYMYRYILALIYTAGYNRQLEGSCQDVWQSDKIHHMNDAADPWRLTDNTCTRPLMFDSQIVAYRIYMPDGIPTSQEAMMISSTLLQKDSQWAAQRAPENAWRVLRTKCKKSDVKQHPGLMQALLQKLKGAAKYLRYTLGNRYWQNIADATCRNCEIYREYLSIWQHIRWI